MQTPHQSPSVTASPRGEASGASFCGNSPANSHCGSATRGLAALRIWISKMKNRPAAHAAGRFCMLGITADTWAVRSTWYEGCDVPSRRPRNPDSLRKLPEQWGCCGSCGALCPCLNRTEPWHGAPCSPQSS